MPKKIQPKKKSSPSYKKRCETVQRVANEYARRRDCYVGGGANCISCGQWREFDELDGGHFIPTTSSAIRFDERNINAQCRRCNRFLHGNPRHYNRGMLAKYGQGVVTALEAREFEIYTYSDEELAGIKAYYRGKLRDIAAGKDPRESNQVLGMQDLFKSVGQADQSG